MRKMPLLLAAVFLLSHNAFGLAAGRPESKSYLYYGTVDTYLHNVGRTGESLTIVAPDYFEVASDGGLRHTKTPDRYFVERMHDAGIRVIPFVSNHWSRENGRAALGNADAVVRELVRLVEEYNFDGVDIDFENLNRDDRAAFTAFMRLLRSALPPDRSVSVCVAANPWGIQSGWQGQYDMRALGEICDIVFLMTYDNHYSGDPVPGDVAGLPFIERSIVQALKEVPASKLMMGVPFYGRYWIEGEETGGKALTVADIYRLTQTYPSRVWYDEATDSARALMTIPQGESASGLWGGKTLRPGVYDIWYENERSLERKLALVRKYGLRGVGSWALGQEPETFWPGYSRWLTGLPFADICGHWSEGAVAELYDLGIVSGVSEDAFAPQRAVTRAELCVMLCRLLGIGPEAAAPDHAADIRGHWAEGYLAAAVRSGLLAGYGDGLFRPSAEVTRREAAVLVAKAIRTTDAVGFNQTVFPDVPRESWAYEAVTALFADNVICGYPDGSFRPEGSLTRAEAASIVRRALDFPRNEFSAARRMRTGDPQEQESRPIEPR